MGHVASDMGAIAVCKALSVGVNTSREVANGRVSGDEGRTRRQRHFFIFSCH